MKRVRRAYRPSRLCPHRWCLSMHTLATVLGMAAILVNAAEALRQVLGSLLIGLILSIPVRYLVKKPGVEAQLNRGAIELQKAATPNSRLQVDRTWARVAVFFDFLLILFIIPTGMTMTKAVPAASAIATVVSSLTYRLIYLFIGGGTFYIHWRATRRPRRRVRADSLVPVEA